MNAKIIKYDCDGKSVAPSKKVLAHVCFNERPVIVNVEIQLSLNRFMGVQLDLAELEAEIAKLRAAGKIK